MEPPSRSPRISISNQTSRRIPVAMIRAGIVASLARHGRSGDVDVAFVPDEEIQQLNAKFRGVDEPTDVLTFPAPEFPHAPLGEIVIGVPFAQRQALIRNVSLRTELAYLAIHGALHLCGFDDIEDNERAEMMREMSVVGAEIGLPEDKEWTSIAKGAAA